MTIKKAIKLIESIPQLLRGAKIEQALAALRSLQGLATEEELRGMLGAYYSGNTVMAFRAGEQFARRRIFGE